MSFKIQRNSRRVVCISLPVLSASQPIITLPYHQTLYFLCASIASILIKDSKINVKNAIRPLPSVSLLCRKTLWPSPRHQNPFSCRRNLQYDVTQCHPVKLSSAAHVRQDCTKRLAPCLSSCFPSPLRSSNALTTPSHVVQRSILVTVAQYVVAVQQLLDLAFCTLPSLRGLSRVLHLSTDLKKVNTRSNYRRTDRPSSSTSGMRRLIYCSLEKPSFSKIRR